MRVLVTGSSGMLGTNLLLRLSLESNITIYGMLRSSPRFQINGVKYVICEMNDISQLNEHVNEIKPDVVINCAASGLKIPKPCWFDMTRFNVHSTLELFKICCQHPNIHFIHISTGLVYRNMNRKLNEDDPLETLHPYGASKAAADLLLRASAVEHGMLLTVLRPFSFTGRHDVPGRLFHTIIESAYKKQTIHLTPGEQYRDFCDVEDVVEAIIKVLDRSRNKLVEIYNIGSEIERPLKEIILDTCSSLKLKANLNFGSLNYSPYENMHLVADTSKMKSEFNWKPRKTLSQSVFELSQQLYPSFIADDLTTITSLR